MTDDRSTHLEDVAPPLWPPPHRCPRRARGGRAAGAPSSTSSWCCPSAAVRGCWCPPGAGRPPPWSATTARGGRPEPARRAGALALALRWRAGLACCAGTGCVVTAPAGRSPGHPARPPGRACSAREVVLGMHLGPPRANRKPVLQLLSPQGRTVAYAKIGGRRADRRAGRDRGRRAAAARPGRDLRWPRCPTCCTPAGGTARELLVQSALPVWSRRRAADRGHGGRRA